jgi:putative DNA primase/helicase
MTNSRRVTLPTPAPNALTTEWQPLRNRDGHPRQVVANVVSLIEAHPDLKDAFSFDEFANRVLITERLRWVHGPLPAQWTDADRIELQIFMQELGFPVSKESIVQDGVLAVARRRRFHPVREYLRSLEWDGTERLGDWLTTYCHADVSDSDRKRYVQAVGRATLISAVARVMEPGCKVDSVLTLLSPQGWRKSSAISALSEPWTTDSLPDLHTKDAAIQIQGVWLVEMSELSSVNRSAVENTKAFISRRTDRYRPPYGRNAEDFPRQSIFMATTNTSAFLRDETGNRRFWPVRLTAPIDVDALRRDRDQLWAEAYQAFISGEKWHLSPDLEEIAMAEQELRRAPNPAGRAS